MSERGRLQDVVHDELDRQGVSEADADGIIDAILNVRDFFPLLLGGRAVQDDGLDVERLQQCPSIMVILNRYGKLNGAWWDRLADEYARDEGPPVDRGSRFYVEVSESPPIESRIASEPWDASESSQPFTGEAAQWESEDYQPPEASDG